MDGAKASTGWQGWPIDAPKPAIAPFDASQAKAHQQAWAAYVKVPVNYTNSIGMKFRLIPAGEFVMGSAPTEAGTEAREQPQHLVRVTRPSYLGVHEVTVAQYRRMVNATKYRTLPEKSRSGASQLYPNGGSLLNPACNWKNPLLPQTDEQPVVCITQEDAVVFCEWLSRKEKVKYRLPTVAEWEYACRAGTTTRYSGGGGRRLPEANREYGRPGPEIKIWRGSLVVPYLERRIRIYGAGGKFRGKLLRAFRYARKRLGILFRLG